MICSCSRRRIKSWRGVDPERVGGAEGVREVVGLVLLKGGRQVAGGEGEVDVPEVLLVDDAGADLVAYPLQHRHLAQHLQRVLLLQPRQLELLDRLVDHREARPRARAPRDALPHLLELRRDSQRFIASAVASTV